MWSVWDKKAEINGVSAKDILERNKHLQDEEAIFIETVDGRVTNIECKSVLVEALGIYPNLPNNDFLAEYESILAKIMGK